MTREELIAALEKATGPSRELDREVARFAGWHRVEPRHHRSRGGRGKGGWIAPQDWLGAHSDGSPVLDSLHGTTIHADVPPYTSSIDAALTLVPKGYGTVSASINERGTSSMRIGHPYVSGNAATPALALCIAALMASGNCDETNNGKDTGK